MAKPVMKYLPRCPCGEDHSRASSSAQRRHLRRIIQRGGRTQTVVTSYGTWEVPRVWVAFHGLHIEQIPALAAYYGWGNS